MQEFNQLIEGVKKAGHEIFWFGPASDDQVSKLEDLLQLRLPESFKEFLKAYGGGGVIGAEISGIEENDASLDSGGTVYGDTLTAREDYELPDGLVVIFFRDDEICWCLDTTSEGPNGECPVVSYSLFHRKIDNKIADNFNDFLKEYLELRSQ